MLLFGLYNALFWFLQFWQDGVDWRPIYIYIYNIPIAFRLDSDLK